MNPRASMKYGLGTRTSCCLALNWGKVMYIFWQHCGCEDPQYMPMYDPTTVDTILVLMAVWSQLLANA